MHAKGVIVSSSIYIFVFSGDFACGWWSKQNNNECMHPWRQLVCLQNLGRDIENYIVEIAAVGGKGNELHNHLLQTQLFKHKDILQ